MPVAPGQSQWTATQGGASHGCRAPINLSARICTGKTLELAAEPGLDLGLSPICFLNAGSIAHKHQQRCLLREANKSESQKPVKIK